MSGGLITAEAWLNVSLLYIKLGTGGRPSWYEPSHTGQLSLLSRWVENDDDLDLSTVDCVSSRCVTSRGYNKAKCIDGTTIRSSVRPIWCISCLSLMRSGDLDL